MDNKTELYMATIEHHHGTLSILGIYDSVEMAQKRLTCRDIAEGDTKSIQIIKLNEDTDIS